MFNKKQNQNFDLEMFTIYDSKTLSYDIPSSAINANDLIRQIINMFKDPQQSKNKFLVNAEDYSIFKIGGYSKQTGQLTAQNLEHVANMHDLRAQSQPSEYRYGLETNHPEQARPGIVST